MVPKSAQRFSEKIMLKQAPTGRMLGIRRSAPGYGCGPERLTSRSARKTLL
jgi:hypothetical protein